MNFEIIADGDNMHAIEIVSPIDLHINKRITCRTMMNVLNKLDMCLYLHNDNLEDFAENLVRESIAIYLCIDYNIDVKSSNYSNIHIISIDNTKYYLYEKIMKYVEVWRTDPVFANAYMEIAKYICDEQQKQCAAHVALFKDELSCAVMDKN